MREYVTEPDPMKRLAESKQKLAESFRRNFGLSEKEAAVCAGLPDPDLAKAILENKDLRLPEIWALLTEKQ